MQYDTAAHELTGIVLGFLLGFRVESCATRFQEGLQVEIFPILIFIEWKEKLQ